jgi:hypothetical protein
LRSDTQDASVAVLQAALSRYLDRHPRAADTLEGIALWWLPAPLGRDSRPEDLARAVAQLTESGRLQRVESPDGQVIYANRR